MWTALKSNVWAGQSETAIRGKLLINEHIYHLSIDAEKNDNQNIDGAEWFIKKFLQHFDGHDAFSDNKCLIKDCPDVKCNSPGALARVLSVAEKNKHNWAQGK